MSARERRNEEWEKSLESRERDLKEFWARERKEGSERRDMDRKEHSERMKLLNEMFSRLENKTKMVTKLKVEENLLQRVMERRVRARNLQLEMACLDIAGDGMSATPPSTNFADMIISANSF